MATNFHIGQKVVCVNADRKKILHPRERRSADWHLVKGKIYTIAGFQEDFLGVARVHLLGCDRQDDGLINSGYGLWRFRPVFTKNTDISIFKAILENPRIPIEA